MAKDNDFNKFFSSYSQNVDQAQFQYFWKLSDELVKAIIINNIPSSKVTSKQTILDAGGGTGRWICELSKIYKSKFILYDLSEDMLKKAESNLAKAKITDRVSLVNGDLSDMSSIKNSSVDHIISIYNPISFVPESLKAAKELNRILKDDGKIIIMGQNGLNVIYSKINNYLASASELKKLEKDFMVKWDKDIPKLHVFDKEKMEAMLTNAGFKIEKSYGVPVFVQPGPEDFDPENKKISRISKALQNTKFFKTVFDIEMKYNSLPTVVNRGMNIFTVGVKGSK